MVKLVLRWVFKGEVYGKRDLSPNVGVSSASAPSASNTGGAPGGARRKQRGDRPAGADKGGEAQKRKKK